MLSKGAVGLVAWRKENNLSQAGAGEKMGLHQTNVSQYELGQKVPGPEVRERIKTATNIPLEDWDVESPVQPKAKRKRAEQVKPSPKPAAKPKTIQGISGDSYNPPYKGPAKPANGQHIWRASTPGKLGDRYILAADLPAATKKALAIGFDPAFMSIAYLGEAV